MTKPSKRQRSAPRTRTGSMVAASGRRPEASGASTFDPGSRSETFATLLRLAHGATLRIPPALLVQHVVGLPGDADWPVRRAAMEALLRRCGFAERDRLRIASRPSREALFGTYRTRRPRESERPYTTWLKSLDPIRGSCDCPDYLRSSLGICKHMLAVLDDLARRPRRLARALGAPAASDGARLAWDPVRPLLGPGDWLARVRWIGYDGNAHTSHALFVQARRWFRAAADGELEAVLPDLGRVEQRAAMVEDLWRLVERDGRRGRATLAVEPALRALLAAERRHLERVRADRADRPAFERTLRSLHRRLYPYQTEGVRRFLDAGRLLLADDMGLGKTVQAIAACHVLWHTGKVRRGLLIVPASLKPQWQREWQRLHRRATGSRRGRSPTSVARAYRRRQPRLPAWSTTSRCCGTSACTPGSRRWWCSTRHSASRTGRRKTAAYVKRLQPRYRLVLTGTPDGEPARRARLDPRVGGRSCPGAQVAPRAVARRPGAPASARRRAPATSTPCAHGSRPACCAACGSEVLDQLPPRTDTDRPGGPDRRRSARSTTR